MVGNIHLFNLYLPLLHNGRVKKAIVISSGMADNEWIKEYAIDNSAPYAISKAAVNTAVAKFDAAYAKDGILFMAICPGLVGTGHFDNGKTFQQLTMPRQLTFMQLMSESRR